MIHETFLTEDELMAVSNGNISQKDAASISSERRNDMINVLKSESGKRVIWRMLARGGIFKTTYTGNAGTHYNEGMRALALNVLNEVQSADPRSFIAMQEDQLKEETRYV